MKIAVDFDGTIVSQERAYDDLETPLEFLPGALEALLALKRAGHQLLLWSGRANRALRENIELDPFVRAGAAIVDRARWEASKPLHEARFQQMLAFVDAQLPDVFDAVDDGAAGGKPMVDLFIDDRAMRYGDGGESLDWMDIALRYGRHTTAEESG